MTPDQLFDQLLSELGQQRRPPVALWQPERNGEIDIYIDRSGQWHHEGVPMGRDAIVRLFATILRRDPDGYVLVTPAERLLIQVEDVPFVAVDCEVRACDPVEAPVTETSATADAVPGLKANTDLLFTTNVGDLVLADAQHGIRMAEQPGTGVHKNDATQVPYLHVRGGLEARIARSVYYRLLDHVQLVDGVAYLASNNSFFTLGPAA